MISLKDGLDELAAEVESSPPIARLLERGRRARVRRRTITLALPALVIAGALGASAVMPPSQAPPQDPRDPRLELVAALENTQQSSFRFRIQGESGAHPDNGENRVYRYGYTGAFDPVALAGYSRVEGHNREFRLIDGIHYRSEDGGQSWLKEPEGEYKPGVLGDGMPNLATAPLDQKGLLTFVHLWDAQVTKTGDNTYQVTKIIGSARITVDVTLDEHRRPLRVHYVDVDSRGSRGSILTEYSHYGEPVTVEHPTNLISQR